MTGNSKTHRKMAGAPRVAIRSHHQRAGVPPVQCPVLRPTEHLRAIAERLESQMRSGEISTEQATHSAVRYLFLLLPEEFRSPPEAMRRLRSPSTEQVVADLAQRGGLPR